MARWAIVWALSYGLGGPQIPSTTQDERPEDRAAALEQRALDHFGATRYDDAFGLFLEAYALEPTPRFLYAAAQSARLSGDCETATTYYALFLQRGVRQPTEIRDAAQANIDACEDSGPPDPPSEKTVPPPQLVAQPSPPTTDVEPPTQPPRDWRRDPWGGALVGMGAITTVVGTSLLALVGNDRLAASRRPTEGEYGTLEARYRPLTAAGVATLVVGVATLTGGLLRFRAVRRRPQT